MKLKSFYQEVVKKGLEADIRSKKEIDELLKKRKKEYERLDKNKKELFDLDSLVNPFADTRILHGDPEQNIKSIIVGIDVGGEELLLVDRLKNRNMPVDLVVSHHPAGRAYAHFYEVMDVQADIFAQHGVGMSASESLLSERKGEVERRVSAANHQRSVDIARFLNISFLCAHTPADNLAYQYVKETMDKAKPQTLGEIVDILYTIPEYRDTAKNNNPPKIVIGNKSSRVKNIYYEFTGGTEGPVGIYEKLASSGIDTIIAMHQSEAHFKKCKEARINVIVASHIASDNLGMNILLDYLSSKEKLKIYEFSGFRRFSRKKGK